MHQVIIFYNKKVSLVHVTTESFSNGYRLEKAQHRSEMPSYANYPQLSFKTATSSPKPGEPPTNHAIETSSRLQEQQHPS